ncbi:MAG: sialate O-acetylesterase [Verrucomicrobiota bacterium]
MTARFTVMNGLTINLSLPCLAMILVLSTAGVPGPAKAQSPDPNFHLYLLIGQSNMAGRGAVDEESKKPHPRVEMLAKNLTWQPATDPLHFDKSVAGVGPGLAFGKQMAEANPRVRIGLIPCAVGGTSIKAWVPGAEDKATKTHPYDDMLKRVREAQKAGVLKGIIWHQGEADRHASAAYGQALSNLIAMLRQELNAPEASFVAGELSSFGPKEETQKATKQFNEVVQGLAKKVKRYGCASAEGLNHKGDQLHYNTESARTFGKRYAEKMIELQK